MNPRVMWRVVILMGKNVALVTPALPVGAPPRLVAIAIAHEDTSIPHSRRNAATRLRSMAC